MIDGKGEATNKVVDVVDLNEAKPHFVPLETVEITILARIECMGTNK